MQTLLVAMHVQEAHAAKLGKDVSASLRRELQAQELLRMAGRYHTRLQNIEEECWVYQEQLPQAVQVPGPDLRDAYFWRRAFHPLTLQEVSGAG